MLSSSDDDVRQLGDHRRSLSPGESDKSRLEQYQDEVQKIKDAFGDDSWYGDEVPMPENEDTISGEHTDSDYIIIVIVTVFIIYFIPSAPRGADRRF